MDRIHIILAQKRQILLGEVALRRSNVLMSLLPSRFNAKVVEKVKAADIV